MTLFEYAKAYQEKKGWSCIPCLPKNKQAAVSWKAYQERRPDEQELHDFFTGHEDRNLAIITGDVSNRLLVIDFDEPELFVLWQERNRIDSWTVITGKGVHVYFTLAPGENPPLNGKFCVDGQIAGDVRYNGGYVLAPPSMHPNGLIYRWACGGSELMTVRFGDLNLTRPAVKPTHAPGRGRPKQQQEQSSAGAFPGVPGYVKNPKAYARAGLDREIQNILGATAGEDRNIKLFNAAWKLRRYAPLLGGESTIEQTLTELGQRIGLPLSEVQRTIRSAFNY